MNKQDGEKKVLSIHRRLTGERKDDEGGRCRLELGEDHSVIRRTGGRYGNARAPSLPFFIKRGPFRLVIAVKLDISVIHPQDK